MNDLNENLKLALGLVLFVGIPGLLLATLVIFVDRWKRRTELSVTRTARVLRALSGLTGILIGVGAVLLVIKGSDPHIRDRVLDVGRAIVPLWIGLRVLSLVLRRPKSPSIARPGTYCSERVVGLSENLQGSWEVSLSAVPSENKIAAIKAVREVMGLGLKEAKDLVESAPIKITGVSSDFATYCKRELEKAGTLVEIKDPVHPSELRTPAVD